MVDVGTAFGKINSKRQDLEEHKINCDKKTPFGVFLFCFVDLTSVSAVICFENNSGCEGSAGKVRIEEREEICHNGIK